MMRWFGAALGLVTTLTAGCFLFDDPTDPTTTGTSTTGDTMTPTSGFGTAGECNVPDDCPWPGQCQGPVCVEGACGAEYLPEGTPWFGGPSGDCYVDLCDGAGGVYAAVGDDPPPQVPGDCHRYVCEEGNTLTKIDDSDLPADGNDCTQDSCAMGVPANTLLPQHSPCGELGASFCHADGVCRRCKEVTAMCEDYGGEPHENQETSLNLGKISDDDGDGSYACGTLRGANDVDWFTFEGDDKLGNLVDPFRSLVTQNGDGARVCVYFQCLKDSTTVDCKSETPSTSPLGHKGCCSSTSVAPKLNCGGLDDAAKVWIRLDNPQKLACVPYELDYHF